MSTSLDKIKEVGLKHLNRELTDEEVAKVERYEPLRWWKEVAGKVFMMELGVFMENELGLIKENRWESLETWEKEKIGESKYEKMLNNIVNTDSFQKTFIEWLILSYMHDEKIIGNDQSNVKSRDLYNVYEGIINKEIRAVLAHENVIESFIDKKDNYIPPELSQHISTYLGIKDIANLSAVNKSTAEAAGIIQKQEDSEPTDESENVIDFSEWTISDFRYVNKEESDFSVDFDFGSDWDENYILEDFSDKEIVNNYDEPDITGQKSNHIIEDHEVFLPKDTPPETSKTELEVINFEKNNEKSHESSTAAMRKLLNIQTQSVEKELKPISDTPFNKDKYNSNALSNNLTPEPEAEQNQSIRMRR